MAFEVRLRSLVAVSGALRSLVGGAVHDVLDIFMVSTENAYARHCVARSCFHAIAPARALRSAEDRPIFDPFKRGSGSVQATPLSMEPV